MVKTVEDKRPAGRASALPPDERRSAIIAATLPLLLEHAEMVTTRKIAEAAGIAEGTIFRVFADKDEVITAVIDEAVDPAPVEAALAALDPSAPLEQVLAAAIALVQRRTIEIWRLMSSVGPRFHERVRRPMTDNPGVVAIFEHHAAEISVSPLEAARRLRAVTLASSHPMLAEEPLPPEEIAAMFLHGIVLEHAVLIRLLRTHLRPYKRPLLLIVVLQSVQTAAALTLPGINADIIDKGVLTGDTGYIRAQGAVMLGFSVVQVVFSVAAVYFGARVAMGFGRDLRASLFHQVNDFSAREVGAFGAPSLITRITNDVQQVQMLVVMAATMAIAAPITMVVGVIMALREDVGLSVVLVVAMPVSAVVLGVIVGQMVPTFRRMQDQVDRINRVLREQITGIRVVRAFVREPEETQRFAEANDELTATALRGGRLMSSMFPTVNLLINASSVAVLWVGANEVGAGELQVGSLVAYLSYLVQILMSVVMTTFTISQVPRAAVSAGRIQEVLDTPSSVVPPSSPVREVAVTGKLELRGVGFNYPGAEAPVLTDIAFTTVAGRTTAIVGSTGAGKTTLVHLIPRLFDATVGQVLVDDVDVRELDPDRLWSVIGLVPQRPYLFSGTVASNLAFGKPDATEDEMWEALEVAQAADFVRAMPGGLEARIEQGGTNVSGGQRQRLSIARALVRRPEIYVFDDSFSALDLTTDARLRAALGPYTADAAVVIVAQRVSTIATADEILVLEDGVLVGRGTHEELLETCDTYAEIVQSQIGERSAGMTELDDPTTEDDAPKVNLAAADTRAAGRWNSAGVPTERSARFGESVGRLVRLLGPERLVLVVVAVAAVTSAVLNVLGPRVLGHGTDIIIQGVFSSTGIDFGELHRVLLQAIGLYVGSTLLSLFTAWMIAGVVQRMMRRLRADAEAKIHALPLSHIDRQARGDLLSRVTNDLDNLAQSLQQTLSQMLTSVLLLIGVAVMMFTISPLLAAVALTIVPVSVFGMKKVAGRARPKYLAQWGSTGALNAQIEEAFTGHSVVKAFGRQREVEARFSTTNDTLYEASFGAQFMSSLMQPLTMFLGNVQYVLVAVVGGLRVASGQITVGDVQAFIQYSRQFTMPLTQLASMMNIFQSGIASLERVLELLDTPEQVPDDPDAEPLAPVRGRVAFEDVSFAYDPERPLIEHLSLVAEPGQTIAIVGPTGAGKTTLVNLIMRFYELDGGRITLDGRDISDIPRPQLRANLGMVLQDTWLFGGTIRDNIAYGRPDATEAEIMEAARATYVDRFVHHLPDGYDTEINEEGDNISSGQKQLITIARAFLAQPAILILDEATSSVDTRTEVQIQEAMNALRQDRTSFVIAHRLSTIRGADIILVMEDGAIVEQGSHDELLSHDGAYFRLYSSQFTAAAAEVV